ncbi:MAG: hypothetical protein FGM52_12500 [Mycobacterium sp.]|nr:hypothetical protein [Mycobacterium sp.]
MIRLAAPVLVFVSFTVAPVAAADPEILVPDCGGQVAVPGECAPAPEESAAELLLLTPGAFPGANPNVPPGPTPLNFPVVLPLGVTPFNIPPNLPLGPTPPTRFPFQ